MHAEICGACGVDIAVCAECGGLICTAGCPDRTEDGCVCGEAEDGDE